MLGQRQQDQIEHHHRQPHDAVLYRMQPRPKTHFKHNERKEGQADEQHAVLHRAFHQLIVRTGLVQIHADGKLREKPRPRVQRAKVRIRARQ